MRGARRAAIGLAVALMALAPRGAAQTLDTQLDFSAILTNISNVGPTGLTPLDIHITRWTPDAANAKLLTTLRDKGQDAFLRELVEQKPVGWIATPTSLRYDFFYARSAPTEERGQRIILITDRPMRIWERLQAAPSREYPFTVVELRLDKNGEGSGTLAQLVQLRLVGNILGIENLATAPMKLEEVKKKK